MKHFRTPVIILALLACLLAGWFTRGYHDHRTELSRINKAKVYLLTEESERIFAKLGEFGVLPAQVEFLYVGSGIQVKVNAPEERVREIADALQPMIPDLGNTNVHFNIEGDYGGILVQKGQMFDNRPLVKAMLTDLNALDHMKKSEQAGAGQPATRPESMSEGGDKPQHESEERSR